MLDRETTVIDLTARPLCSTSRRGNNVTSLPFTIGWNSFTTIPNVFRRGRGSYFERLHQFAPSLSLVRSAPFSPGAFQSHPTPPHPSSGGGSSGERSERARIAGNIFEASRGREKYSKLALSSRPAIGQQSRACWGNVAAYLGPVWSPVTRTTLQIIERGGVEQWPNNVFILTIERSAAVVLSVTLRRHRPFTLSSSK